MPDFFTRLRAALERGQRFVTRDIWHVGQPGEPLPSGFIIKNVRVAILLVRGLAEETLLLRASALTFATTLFLVPFLAFMFAFIQTFNLGEQVYGFLAHRIDEKLMDLVQNLQESLPPLPEVEHPSAPPSPPSPQEQNRLLWQALISTLFPGSEQQIGNVQNPVRIFVRLAERSATDPRSLGIATVFYVLTTILGLMRNVEWSFNRIWGVQRARGLLRTASDYMLITLLLPFGAAFVLGINAALENPALVEMLGTLSYGLRLIQLLLICLIFSLLYWLVPNTRVEIPYALLGGVVAGILWMLLAWAYVKFQFGLPRYTLFFSTFALIPLLLMWIYSSWLILLFGALLSFAYQNEKTFAMERWVDRASFAYREMLALRVMIELTRRFVYGLAPWPAATLAAALNVPSRLLNETLARLEESGLVLTCAGDPPTYVPGRAPETIRVRHVLDALRYAGEEPSLLRQEPGFRSLYERLRAWEPTVLDCPLTDWLRETDKDAQTNAVPSTGRDAMEGANRDAVD